LNIYTENLLIRVKDNILIVSAFAIHLIYFGYLELFKTVRFLPNFSWPKVDKNQ